MENALIADTLPFSNYYNDDYLSTNVRAGVTHNRAGTRLLALSSDFLLGLRNALGEECGEAADTVFYSCGKNWGRQFGRKFQNEMMQFYGRPLHEFPVMLFESCLVEAFSRHGWGRIRLDYSAHERGLILIDLHESVFADLVGKADKPVEAMMAGVFGGLFSEIAGQDLDSVQTTCKSCGATVSRFVITLSSRLAPCREMLAEGKTHDEIVAYLERDRSK